MTDNTSSRHFDGWDGWEIWYYGSEASLHADVVDAPSAAPMSAPSPTPHLWIVRDDADTATPSLATLPWPSDTARHATAACAVRAA